MDKPIQVELTDEAIAFLKGLSLEARRKFGYYFELVERGSKDSTIFKKLTGTADIWEFRVKANRQYFRMLAFWDRTKPVATLVVCTHGFSKTSGKTPSKEIAKAEKLKAHYFEK